MHNLREKIKPTLNKILSFFLLIGVAVLIFPIPSLLHAEESDSIPIANEQLPALPQGFIADKNSYSLLDNIKISNAPSGSAIEIYRLDDPDTAPEPSNVYATMVGDDGMVNIDTATLLPGRFALVNTFEPGQCGGFYLSQCRARSDYLGEVIITIP